MSFECQLNVNLMPFGANLMPCTANLMPFTAKQPPKKSQNYVENIKVKQIPDYVRKHRSSHHQAIVFDRASSGELAIFTKMRMTYNKMLSQKKISIRADIACSSLCEFEFKIGIGEKLLQQEQNSRDK